jgi:hypothetical protein
MYNNFVPYVSSTKQIDSLCNEYNIEKIIRKFDFGLTLIGMDISRHNLCLYVAKKDTLFYRLDYYLELISNEKEYLANYKFIRDTVLNQKIYQETCTQYENVYKMPITKFEAGQIIKPTFNYNWRWFSIADDMIEVFKYYQKKDINTLEKLLKSPFEPAKQAVSLILLSKMADDSVYVISDEVKNVMEHVKNREVIMEIYLGCTGITSGYNTLKKELTDDEIERAKKVIEYYKDRNFNE